MQSTLASNSYKVMPPTIVNYIMKLYNQMTGINRTDFKYFQQKAQNTF